MSEVVAGGVRFGSRRRWAWRIIGAVAGGGLYIAVHGSGPGVWLATMSMFVGAATTERPRSLFAVAAGALIGIGLFVDEGYDSTVDGAVAGAFIGLGGYWKRRWTLNGTDSAPKAALVMLFDQLVPFSDLLWLVSLISLLTFPAVGAAGYGADVGANLGGALGLLSGAVAGAGATILTWSRSRELIERKLTWMCGAPGNAFRDPADYARERDQP